MDYKFEVVVIPVADVDRARDFCRGLGWRLDADFAPGPDWPAWYARYMADESAGAGAGR